MLLRRLASIASRSPLVRSFAVLLLLAAASPAHAQRIRVVSWNVWGVPWVSPDVEARLAAVPEALAELSPDVVALQEVWEPAHGDLLAEGLRAIGLPHVQHVRGAGRKGGLLVASRWPMDELGFVPFSMGRVGIVPWHVDYMANKGVARFRVHAPGGDFVFVDTHLQASYGGRYATVRLSQSLELARALDAFTEPVIVAGDFNSRSHELPFRALRAAARLTDATPGFGIDGVLFRGGFRVLERRRALHAPRDLAGGARRRLSDHDAVFVELERAAVAAPPALDWRRVRAEAQRFAASSRAAWQQASWGARAAALFFVGLVAVFARRRRRRRAALGLALAAGLLLYLGFAYGPSEERGMGETLRRLEVADTPNDPAGGALLGQRTAPHPIATDRPPISG